MYECKILADSFCSISPDYMFSRLVTFQITYPLIVHNELLTHRVISRCAASNRAIPVKKILDRVRDNPFVPECWPKNQSGMQAQEMLDADNSAYSREGWTGAINSMIGYAEALRIYGVHKQIVNRLLGPFSWITVIASATDWANFFALRVHPDAQPEIQKIARMMAEAYVANRANSKMLKVGDWHLPMISDEDWEFVTTPEAAALMPLEQPLTILKALSAARCARVSYLSHEGKRDPAEDIKLWAKLSKSQPPHMSPFEHQATPCDCYEAMGNQTTGHLCGCAYPNNFVGFHQYRKEFSHERSDSFTLDGKLYDASGELVGTLDDLEDVPMDESLRGLDVRPEDRD